MALEDWGIKPVVPISDEQFALWQGLIESRAGMTFTQTRRPFLEISLSTRMREITIEDYDAYYQFVVSGARGEREWLLLVDRLAVQETSFFRHASSYALVETHIKALLAKPQISDIKFVECRVFNRRRAVLLGIDGRRLVRNYASPRCFLWHYGNGY
jgi:hypothetical protein